MGAVQLGFSGGEPLLREDLSELVAAAHELGFYTNLITSGVGLTPQRAASLRQAGLDHIQLSFQDSSRELNDFLSSTRTFDLKQRVARTIKELGYPMVLNCVMHRYNLPHVDRIVRMAEAMEADFLELANVQYYGWAWRNREMLMPSRAALAQAEAVVDAHRPRLEGRMRILWVVPDYAEGKPKPCMAGWGSVFLVVAPDGVALPCHSARMLPGLDFPNVREHPVRDIWQDSAAFQAYRGTGWMSPTCSSCEHREQDHGGCRCQAFLLTGDAAATDPVCPRSPHHHEVGAMVDAAAGLRSDAAPIRFVPGARRAGQLVFRSDENALG